MVDKCNNEDNNDNNGQPWKVYLLETHEQDVSLLV